MALSNYLNNVLLINVTDFSDLELQYPLVQSSPKDPNSNVIYNDTNPIQKAAYFLMANGLRSMRL